MSRLFAFNNAEDLVMCNLPAGHYDAEQQLWVADDRSRASLSGDTTYLSTINATMSGGTVTDWIYDLALD